MMDCQLTILNNLGHPITTLDSELSSPEDVREGADTTIECRLDSLPLIPGRYRIDVLLRGRQEIQDGLQAAAYFDVEPGLSGGRPLPADGSDGDTVLPHAWKLPA
jgi:lipopolysaccharide transport system ATP-binding protein